MYINNTRHSVYSSSSADCFLYSSVPRRWRTSPRSSTLQFHARRFSIRIFVASPSVPHKLFPSCPSDLVAFQSPTAGVHTLRWTATRDLSRSTIVLENIRRGEGWRVKGLKGKGQTRGLRGWRRESGGVELTYGKREVY